MYSVFVGLKIEWIDAAAYFGSDDFVGRRDVAGTDPMDGKKISFQNLKNDRIQAEFCDCEFLDRFLTLTILVSMSHTMINAHKSCINGILSKISVQ